MEKLTKRANNAAKRQPHRNARVSCKPIVNGDTKRIPLASNVSIG
ncbi:hypothetical protein Hdeb2414_s0008g00297241 [Helianthus debilis subsp. tardiflorus]